MKSLTSHPLRVLGILIVATVLLSAGARSESSAPPSGANATGRSQTDVYPTMGNPAAAYCQEMGYKYEVVQDHGQRGICHLPNAVSCDAWRFLQGTCGESYSYCAQNGYETRVVSDGRDPFLPEYAVCVTGDGAPVGSVTELSNLAERAADCGASITVEERPSAAEPTETYAPSSLASPPSAFDWRAYQGSNWMTPIRDQGQCGSCWAFSAVSVAEAAHNIANNDPALDKDLSEQYLVSDCFDYGLYGQSCCGGWHAYALTYIRDSGIPDEACIPYVDGTGCSCYDGSCDANCNYNNHSTICSDRTCSDRCGDWASRLDYIASTGSVPSDRQTIQQALVDTGPLAVAMGVSSQFGGGFQDGVYRCADDSGANHAVVIVGYDDAGGYWWVRNSWGSSWNEDGYFKVGYGECYIEQRVYYAETEPFGPGPLTYDAYAVDDDTLDQSSGDGDGIAECGETIELYVDLYNQGGGTALDVNVSISSTDSYITFTHNTESTYPDIPGGASATNASDFEVELAPGTPDGHVIDFDLDITASNGGPWSDTFDVVTHCPPPCEADIDGDGVVDAHDLQEVASRWRESAGAPYDQDGDGLVTAIDLMMVTAEWGSCP